MSEMIKISVSNWKTNKKFVAMKAHKVFENVSFGTLSFKDDYWDGCKFVNCEFNAVYARYRNDVSRMGIVFKNCTFRNNSTFLNGHMSLCQFIGCKFDNCTVHTEFVDCKFIDCKFDHCRLDMPSFDKCSFKRCEAEFGTVEAVTCVDCVGKAFVRILSPLACPEKGEYEAWKECIRIKNGKKVYAKLLITADAQRSSAHGNKCRASKAKVLGFYNEDGKRIKLKTACSWWDESFIYRVGATVEPTSQFNKDRYAECTSGIHHFMTLEEAVAWN